MITNPKGKNLVHELTMEYIKQNNLLHCSISDIPKQVGYIVDVENAICDCVEKRLKDFKSI